MRLAVLRGALADVKGEVSDFEPALVTTGDAALLLDTIVEFERTLVAARTLVAGRAAESRQWKTEGYRSPTDWLAQKMGAGFVEASGTLVASEQVASLPETTEALRRGELSGPQVREIAATASSDPRTESALLQTARGGSLKGLRDECRRVKARAEGEKEARARYEQIRKTRFLRLGTDPDGAGRIEAKLTPDDLARVAAAIRRQSSAVFDEARQAGRREPTAAYDADALVALVTGTATTGDPDASAADSSGAGPTAAKRSGSKTNGTGRPTTMMHLRVDLAALRRGELRDNEVCELPGVGPVPLATAVNVLGEAILKVIITDGVDVTSVTHRGRAIPAHIRTALEDRDAKCVVPGCEVAKGLQIDHYKIGFAQDGPTELWNLAHLCRWHHYLKTHCGYVISGDPGSWEWNAPAGAGEPLSSGYD
jgi:hypothetical protein